MNYEKKYLKYKNHIAGTQNIKLFIEDSWQPAQDYHVFAFNEYLKNPSKTYIFDNGVKGVNRIYFSIIRKEPFGALYRIREDGSENPITDFNDVKVFLEDHVEGPNWYETHPNQQLAYFNYIYSGQYDKCRYYKLKDHCNSHYEKLTTDDNSNKSVDFYIYGVRDGAVYLENDKGYKIRISHDNTFRESILGKYLTKQIAYAAQSVYTEQAAFSEQTTQLSCQILPPNPLIWFDRVFKFHEMCAGSKIRSRVREELRVEVQADNIILINQQSIRFEVGKVRLISTHELVFEIRHLEFTGVRYNNKLTYTEVYGDVKLFHLNPLLAGSLFQVASQFNALEMQDTTFTPEMGITIYEKDHTQGPVCAIACSYGTLYRNYFSMPGGRPQTEKNQINTLDNLILEYNLRLKYENGYIYPSSETEAIRINNLFSNTEIFKKAVGLVKYFIQYNTPVVKTDGKPLHKVSQIYCSALPIAYFQILKYCPNFSRMILHAVYEATFACAAGIAINNAKRIKVFLTRVGGGVFGNPSAYIEEAINAAKNKFRDYPIDVFMINYADSVDFK